jgi:CubicO group peptidase (beta-lactamase class C family)
MPKPAYNDRLHNGARIDVFGYYTVVNTTARDLARLGWLWCNRGKWGDRQVVPEKWLRETTVTAPDILANCPEDEWKYGHGIWTNDHGKLWPGLPREGFSAQGAGGHQCSVFPSTQLVVVQNPGPQLGGDAFRQATHEFLALVLDACTD